MVKSKYSDAYEQKKAGQTTTEGEQSELAEAVSYYASGEGMYVNQILRRDGFESLTDDEKKLVRDLDKATRADIVDASVLYRSVDASSVFGSMSQLEYEQLSDAIVYGDEFAARQVQTILDRVRPGLTLTEKGFMSTSEDYDVISGWYDFTGSSKPVTLELNVPNGTRGSKVYNLTPEVEARNPQREVLLPRNTQYRVKGITSRDGLIYVIADIV